VLTAPPAPQSKPFTGVLALVCSAIALVLVGVSFVVGDTFSYDGAWIGAVGALAGVAGVTLARRARSSGTMAPKLLQVGIAVGAVSAALFVADVAATALAIS
jgi:membrane-bound ClpP family serine protease